MEAVSVCIATRPSYKSFHGLFLSPDAYKWLRAGSLIFTVAACPAARENSESSGVRAHRLAPPQRLARGLDRCDVWVTLCVFEGGTAVRSPGESRGVCSRYIFLLTRPLTDKWQANSLVCSDAVKIRHHRRRSRFRSVGAAGCDERNNATSRRCSAQRTVPSPPFFCLNDAFWCRHGVSKSSLYRTVNLLPSGQSAQKIELSKFSAVEQFSRGTYTGVSVNARVKHPPPPLRIPRSRRLCSALFPCRRSAPQIGAFRPRRAAVEPSSRLTSPRFSGRDPRPRAARRAARPPRRPPLPRGGAAPAPERSRAPAARAPRRPR